MSSILTPKALRTLFAKASKHRATDTLKRLKLTEAGAEALMRHHARMVFKPSQFYISHGDHMKHVYGRGFDHPNGGLTAEGQEALALWCMRQASKEHDDTPLSDGSGIAMEVLHAFLSSPHLSLYRASYGLLGVSQEALPFIGSAAWALAKAHLREAGMVTMELEATNSEEQLTCL